MKISDIDLNYSIKGNSLTGQFVDSPDGYNIDTWERLDLKALANSQRRPWPGAREKENTLDTKTKF